MKIETFFYQNDQQKKLYKTRIVNKLKIGLSIFYRGLLIEESGEKPNFVLNYEMLYLKSVKKLLM